ncbi:MAG: HAD family hydrolase [Actinomycetaceae bacterium]|nr:HAD family hydrolase [Actinomycetaceae bacterium]
MSNSLLTPPPTTLPPIPFPQLVSEAKQALPADFVTDPAHVLVALDLDGTLLTETGASDRTREAIRALEAAGSHVVIATGRGLEATRPVMGELDFTDGWMVCSNGALLIRVEDGACQVVRNEQFDPRPVVEKVWSRYPQALVAVEDADGGYRISKPFPPRELIESWTVAPAEDLVSRPVTKLVVRIPGMDRDEFEQRMFALQLPDVEVAVGWTSWMDVSATGVTKASGLERLRADLGVDARGTVSIGDGTNDIAMLQWAQHGVAMAGATQAVRAHADAVTGPVEYDGAAAVMQAVLSSVRD